MFTDGQRKKKTNHSRIKSTASYLIILRFEQLVLQEISHMTSCLQKISCFQKSFRLSAEHNFIFKQESHLSGFRGIKYFKTVR